MILTYDTRALTCACLPVLVLTRKTLNSRARWAVPPLAPPPSSTWPACFQPIDSGQEILRKDDIYNPLKCGINFGVSAKEKSKKSSYLVPDFFN